MPKVEGDLFDQAIKLDGAQEVRRLARPQLQMRVALGTIKVGAGVAFALSMSTDGLVLFIDAPDGKHWVLNFQAQVTEAIGKIIETLPEETRALAMVGAQEPN